MSSKNCLNCGNELSNKFCDQCGQKADTHRITVRHFLEHDLLHGVFHIDKGILFTLKETFTRPGKAAIDYINGKRISYYNIFYLLLIIIGFNFLLVHYSEGFIEASNEMSAEKDGIMLMNFMRANAKYLILSFIPLFAFNAFFIFRRAKLNFAEHHIISGFTLLGCVSIALLVSAIGLLPQSLYDAFFVYVEYVVITAFVLFPMYVYYMAFASQYKLLGFSWRILMMYILFLIEALILLLSIVAIISKGNFEGKLQLA